MPEIKKCPFCGGNAKLSFKKVTARYTETRTYKQYKFQVICNKCHARGGVVKSPITEDLNPWFSSYNVSVWVSPGRLGKQNELCKPYADAAIEAWNRRCDG